MPNIKFSYLYRDGGNYKKYGFVIFADPNNIDLSALETLIQSKLIYDEYFYATEWGLQEFFTEYIDFRIDPTWHEFECVEYTDEPATELLDLKDFIEVVKRTKYVYK